MHALRTGIDVAWLVFWTGWLASALTAKRSLRGAGRGRLRLAGVSAVCVIIIRLANGRAGAVHSPVLEVIGAALLLSGLMLAVWARVQLGGNWGMPMTQRAEPELITAGPYRLAAVYFRYAASVEERNLIASSRSCTELQTGPLRTGSRRLARARVASFCGSPACSVGEVNAARGSAGVVV